MIPVSDVIPSRTKPLITPAIVILTATASLSEHVWGPSDPGMSVVVLPDPLHGGVAVRAFLTSMFVHVGWAPFLGNMLYLWIFGGTVEDRLGHLRFGVLFLLSGTSAVIAHTTLAPQVQASLVGSGGGVAGVLGAYFSLYPNSRVLTFLPLPPGLVEVPAVVFLGLWATAHLAVALAAPGELDAVRSSASATLAACATGLATGATACALMRRPDRLRVEWWGK
jgi:membrane associated rhomboid family serine protease